MHLVEPGIIMKDYSFAADLMSFSQSVWEISLQINLLTGLSVSSWRARHIFPLVISAHIKTYSL